MTPIRECLVCPEPELLGTMTVRALAARWSVSRDTVTRWRQAHGVVVARKRPAVLVAKIVPFLALERDVEIAARIGCSRSRVGQIRAEAGVERPDRPTLQQLGAWICPDPSRLGKETDAALAREWGVSAYYIRTERRRLGIPPARPHPLLDFIRANAGAMTDREMADAYGTSMGVVFQLRRRYRVPAKNRSCLSDGGRARIAAAARETQVRRKEQA